MTKFLFLARMLTIALAISLFPAQAQVAATISGTVEDPSGAGVGGAKIVVTNTETGATRTTSSDDSGHFTFLSLAPGVHDVKVEKSGVLKRPRIPESI